jgi:hypothetical protein
MVTRTSWSTPGGSVEVGTAVAGAVAGAVAVAVAVGGAVGVADGDGLAGDALSGSVPQPDMAATATTARAAETTGVRSNTKGLSDDAHRRC